MEAQDLLKALKRFAESLVHSRKSQQEEQSSSGKPDQLQEVSTAFGNPTTDIAILREADTPAEIQLLDRWDERTSQFSRLDFTNLLAGVDLERRTLLNRIMDEARSMVFNKMPIRLLMFDQKGKGIKLVERSEVLHYLFLDIVAATFDNAGQVRLAMSWTDDSKQYMQDFLLTLKFGQYAILSHTWLPHGEVTYSEWKNHTSLDTQSPGYSKLEKFCEVAAGYGLRLAWTDTVCINKESTTELDESIRSMFKWYGGAKVCVAYLAETTSLDDMDKDKWFTRGWTLQELLASNFIKFHTLDWTAISNNPADQSDKSNFSPISLVSGICNATGLDKQELLDSPDFNNVPIWRKMQWAAYRYVTREEDATYSLMGIFNVSMPTAYGEGAEHAFLRLVKEILSSKSTSVSKLEIANWSFQRPIGVNDYRPALDVQPALDTLSSSILIPASSRLYGTLSESHRNVHFYPPSVPITLSHLGLRVPVLLMPSRTVTRGDIVKRSKKNRPKFYPKGDYSATFVESVKGPNYTRSSRRHRAYNVLDSTLFSSGHIGITDTNAPPDMDSVSDDDIRIFAVINIAEKAIEVLLPTTGPCLAIEVKLKNPPIGWAIPEDLELERKLAACPITFDMVYHNDSSFRIFKDKLNHHGMTLRTMYL
ncbi:hypothetical protein HYPSUDRAFT_171810 [Hypholoma sublateritium FD-334 SS-4]|uniref:Heterokaryon incompatibility domain-containing protein n=1 Tax=Hypholoma sublateritium (strain FD-334 SS-4) TaxID=945553 RepID=A0A0D2NAJ7_HYPSF|nr:hypothetical protein HYPSUDRAFT_171810 [Hypholoma sublateritium FD-334 SS-4]